ncbi:hypothetical protein [Desertibacillus haloalkaliphilus]|uniref:hypothetical protein n=1 Tax=Desertibacillus haloalkaliphilus TaxID=1328930 RepID=UPI001C25871A|nr:hypothetical protein [Desertibacillus haloalkaliphilus]MBU8906603.1 hypothetical protein [Desertibacillus haloalkaliphilus]
MIEVVFIWVSLLITYLFGRKSFKKHQGEKVLYLSTSAVVAIVSLYLIPGDKLFVYIEWLSATFGAWTELVVGK